MIDVDFHQLSAANCSVSQSSKLFSSNGASHQPNNTIYTDGKPGWRDRWRDVRFFRSVHVLQINNSDTNRIMFAFVLMLVRQFSGDIYIILSAFFFCILLYDVLFT